MSYLFQEPIDLCNTYAPEHLIIATADYEQLAEKVVNAGSVFLGNYACESAHLIVRRRFWITTFRISPRTLVKSEVWIGIILTPVLYLFGALVLLARCV